MRRYGYYLLATAMLLSAMPPAHAIKPRPPLRVGMRLANQPAAGQTARIEIHVITMVDIEDVEIKCRLPRGVRLPENAKPVWKLELVKGKPRKIEIEVTLPARKVYKFSATISGRVAGKPIGDIAKLVIDLSPEGQRKPGGNVVKTDKGRRLKVHSKKRTN